MAIEVTDRLPEIDRKGFEEAWEEFINTTGDPKLKAALLYMRGVRDGLRQAKH